MKTKNPAIYSVYLLGIIYYTVYYFFCYSWSGAVDDGTNFDGAGFAVLQ